MAITVDRIHGLFRATCAETGIFSYGRTESEAIAVLKLAVRS